VAPDLRTAKTTIWLTDDQWDVWHAWPMGERMDADGHARTACGDDFTWSPTTKTSYHVLVTVGCYLCRLALEGTPVKRRGRPRHLPAGMRREPAPLVKVEPLPTDLPPVNPKTPTSGPKTRTERLIDAGVTPITYTRPDGRVVTSAHANRATRAKLAAEEVNELDDVASFEVGRHMVSWPCMWCGQVLVEGDRFCSGWCAREQREATRRDRLEYNGLVAARRHFEDVLYRRPRRDRISAWTPPAKQYRTNPFRRATEES